MKTFAFVLVMLVACWILCDNCAQAQYAWTKDSRNPVLLGGAAGSWNSDLFCPFVLFNTDSSRYEMWFTATSGDPPWTIGFATSRDGASWNVYPSPVLSPDPGSWDQYVLIGACVIRENQQYKMWYSAVTASTGPSSIGYATSPDGIHWAKYASNPILGPGTALWELGGPVQCYVMSGPGGYKMWYSAWKAVSDTIRIGYATSTDGLKWQRDTVHNPVLNVGVPAQWDARTVGWPTVLFFKNTYFMWYSGQQVYEKAYKSAGVATSSDGITNWTRYSGNPVFTTTPGSWDQKYAEFTTVVLRGDILHAWYGGEGLVAPMCIGHATSPVTSVGNDERGGIPKVFVLEQNHPNPFNPTTTIRYNVGVVVAPSGVEGHAAINVRLAVYDLLGREVAVLVNEKKAPGRYEVRFDATGLASGVYLYGLTAASFLGTRRMVVLR
jgi:predicted GH43/DUF377 family glycosyl hydrolase